MRHESTPTAISAAPRPDSALPPTPPVPLGTSPPFVLPSPVTAPRLVDGATGHLERLESFPSANVSPRNVDVWLPPGYAEDPRRHAVLYMHDGQNLFVPHLAFSGVDWGVDEALTHLVLEGILPPPIVVGIWNTPQRIAEYMPERPLALRPSAHDAFESRFGAAPHSDAYLRFLVDELKPFVDLHYRTEPDRQHTHIMGSSMGGLISLYALCEYPHVFGGAACLSPSLTIGDRPLFDYLEAHLPPPQTHRLYFDYGAEGQRPYYRQCQGDADALMQRRGYTPEVTWMHRHFPGAGHNEGAWRERIHVPLEFLLGR